MAFEKVGVQAVVEGMSAFRRGIQQIEKGFKQAGDAAKETSKQAEDLNKVMKTVGIGLTAAAAASGAFLFSTVRLAARVETLGVVTKRLGENIGVSEQEIRKLEQSIKDQGITLQASRAAIARMIQSQIDLAKGTKLARLAQDAAVIANLNSSETFERLVFVITSGNVRMARTLGLQVSFQDAYEKTAATLGKTTLELTQLEKIQARTNAVLEAGTFIAGSYEEAMTTAGKKVLSLDRHIEESKRVLGEVWLPVFADAVDAVTNALKSWEDLSEVQQAATSQTIGQVTAFAALTGGILLAIPKIRAAVAGMNALAAAIGTTSLALAAATAGIGLFIAAMIKLLQFRNEVKQQQKEIRDAQKDFVKELLETSDSYERYRREVERVNKVIDDQGIIGTLVADKLELLTEEQFNQIKAQQKSVEVASSADRAMLGYAESLTNLTDEEYLAAREAKRLAQAELEAKEAAEAAKKEQEAFREELEELKFTIDIGLTDSVEEFEKEIGNLEDELAELETERIEAIAEIELEGLEDAERAEETLERLNDRREDAKSRLRELEQALKIAKLRQSEMNDETKESTRLAGEQRIAFITTDIQEQREAISGLDEQIGEWTEGTLTAGERQAIAISELEAEYAEKAAGIRAQIGETQDKFSEQTARLIFDLAQQRLAIDGFTREELDLLNQLAGPQGLGLVDEAGVALLDQIDKVAQGLELPGDQSEQAAEDLFNFWEAIKTDASSGSEAVQQSIEEIPSEVDIVFRLKEEGDLPTMRELGMLSPEALERVMAVLRVSTPGGRQQFATQRQFGGMARKGRGYILGEKGPEFFFPGQTGTVLPNQFVRSLASMFSMALPVAAGGKGGGQSITQSTEMNLTVQSAAEVEPIIQDFEMMRQLSPGR